MLVDASHRRWLVATILGFVVACAAYIPYERLSPPSGPRGSSWPGLAYGGVATFFILIAAVLGVRRKVRSWPLGRAQTWLKAHLWLGLLAYPLVFLHAGFRLGGALTVLLLVLFTIVVVTGIFGLALQQFVPRLMTDQVAIETMFEQVPTYVASLREEARRTVSEVAGTLPGAPPKADAKAKVLEAEEGSEALLHFYTTEVERFLVEGTGRLGYAASRSAAFSHVKTLLPPKLHPVLADVEELCDQRRQLAVQLRLHRWLHGWLVVHLPAAAALVALTAVHAITALYY